VWTEVILRSGKRSAQRTLLEYWAFIATDPCNMHHGRPNSWQRVLAFFAGLLVLKVTVSVVLKYRDYFPPNFGADFLLGREPYFFRGYQWAFYVHIASGPIALILGLMLVSERFRRRFPKWHRRLGRIQVLGVLFLVAPSGLWMAYYAQAGPIAGAGFAALAIATGICVALGWRSAVNSRFADHRRWMWRGFLLLCSAVVIRVIGGLATVTGVYFAWLDPLAAWASWLAPLAIFEANQTKHRRIGSSPARADYL